MLPGRLWQIEIIEDIRNKKSLILKFLLPLLFLSPLMTARFPENLKAMCFSLAVLFTGTFGSAVGLVRLRENKLLERLAVLPKSRSILVSDYILSNAIFDMLQMLAPLAVITFFGGPQPLRILLVFLCFIAAILSANALGVVVSLFAGSSGEVHLYAVLAVIFMGGLSGLFMLPIHDSLKVVTAILPFRQLADTLIYAWGGTFPQFVLLSPFSGGAFFFIPILISSRLFRFH